MKGGDLLNSSFLRGLNKIFLFLLKEKGGKVMTGKQKKLRKELIKESAEKAKIKNRQPPTVSSATKEVTSPIIKNYFGEIGTVVLHKSITHHVDQRVRRLAGEYVKVLTETAELFQCGGAKKIRVGVIPMNLPNPEQVVICLDYIKSNDPIVNQLRFAV